VDVDYRANPNPGQESWGYRDAGDEAVSRDNPNAGGVPVSPGLDLGIESYDLPGELHAYNVLANAGRSGSSGTDFAGTEPGDHP